VVLTGVIGGLLAFRSCRFHAWPPGIHQPTFETYPSHGTEAVVKHLDKQIYDALLALGVDADQVVFHEVKTQQAGSDHWTFSDMEVRFKQHRLPENLGDFFSEFLAGSVPKPTVRVSQKAQNITAIEVRVHGYLTHRLTFRFLATRIPIPRPPRPLPRIAIIIDDMGYDVQIACRFLSLNAPLCFSILPYSPFQDQIAGRLHRKNREILLHLPMEPLEYPQVDPGPGALTSNMTREELVSQLENDLRAVPFAVGVNNHMGSKLTQDAEKMAMILSVLKRKNLFFVDSRTSAKTRCALVAKRLGLPFAQRQVFLDHVQDPHAIRFQIKRLISIANKRGVAIGIGHPYAVTWRVLKENLDKIKSQVQLVPVSSLVG